MSQRSVAEVSLAVSCRVNFLAACMASTLCSLVVAGIYWTARYLTMQSLIIAMPDSGFSLPYANKVAEVLTFCKRTQQLEPAHATACVLTTSQLSFIGYNCHICMATCDNVKDGVL